MKEKKEKMAGNFRKGGRLLLNEQENLKDFFSKVCFDSPNDAADINVVNFFKQRYFNRLKDYQSPTRAENWRGFNDTIELLQWRKVEPEVKAEVDSYMDKLRLRSDYWNGQDFYGFDSRTAKTLFEKEKLGGFCWELSSFMSVFFDEEAKVVRGRLIQYRYYPCLWNYTGYYDHGWIEFERNKKDYVFDPALSILCPKSDYYNFFEPEIEAKISADRVKRFLLEKQKDKESEIEFRGKCSFVIGTKKITDPFYTGRHSFKLRQNKKGEVTQINVCLHDEAGMNACLNRRLK